MENSNSSHADDLLREALRAPKYPALAPHTKTVIALRERQMSWRNIADWLSARNVDVSHTTLRDFYNDEYRRTPVPIWEAMLEEIQKESEALMLPQDEIEEKEGE